MSKTPSRIVVPTDFSPTADLALAVAFGLARTFSAEVHVLHVRVLVETPHLGEKQQHELDQLLAANDLSTQEALGPDREEPPPVATHSHLVRAISASEAIVESCTELDGELLVMGTHGRRGLKHLLLGSVAEAVVRTAQVPVLTIHPQAAPTRDRIERILVPHDFSVHSTQALSVASSWARELQARVTLLHVVEPIVYPEFYAVDLMPEDILHRLRERSLVALEEAADEHLQGLERRCVVKTGGAADTVASVAQEEGVDLVIMGSRGLTGLEHLLLGSVAEKVLRGCKVPLLTVRSAG